MLRRCYGSKAPDIDRKKVRFAHLEIRKPKINIKSDIIPEGYA